MAALLSGQTIDAFLISMGHVDLFSIGLNCALGAAQMRPYCEVLAEQAAVPRQRIPTPAYRTNSVNTARRRK